MPYYAIYETKNTAAILNDMKLDFDYAWYEEGKAWFTDKRMNYIFCADIRKKEIDILGKLPGNQYRNYSKVIKFGSKLICLPCAEKDIIIYNLETGRYTRIAIKNCGEVLRIYCSYAGVFEGKLYFMITNLKRIAALDLVKEEIAFFFDIGCCSAEDVIGHKSELYGHKLYIPIATENKVIVYDIRSKECKEKWIEGDISGISWICRDGDCLWLVGFSYGIVRWDLHTGKISSAKDFPEDFKMYDVIRRKNKRELEWYLYSEKKKIISDDDKSFCWECVCNKENIWNITSRSDSIIRVNAKTMTLDAIKLVDVKEFIAEPYEFILLGLDSDNHIFVFSRRSHELYNINCETLEYYTESWNMTLEALHILAEDLFGKMTNERRGGLEEFVFCLSNKNCDRKGDKVYSTVGTQIYKQIVKGRM
ncbi:MAG: hypothetical protein K2G55_05855 [Lachnospiraceae bacterium]|nr:hypothetical protein [Lachnospiraceae bacterium]